MMSNPDIVFVSKYTSAIHFRECPMLMRIREAEQTLFKSRCFEVMLMQGQFGTRGAEAEIEGPWKGELP